MSIYTNPLYLENTWESYHAFNKSHFSNQKALPELLSLERFKEIVNSFGWPDDLEYLIPTVAKNLGYSLQEQLAVLNHGFADEDHYAFGVNDPDENNEIKALAEIGFANDGTPIPLMKTPDALAHAGNFQVQYSTGENILAEAPLDEVPQYIWRCLFNERAFETMLTPTVELLAKAIDVIKYSKEKGGFIDLVTLSYPAHKAMFILTKHRLLMSSFIALACDDPWGAHDWLFSPDSPLYTTSNAARITSAIRELQHGLDYPNFFEGIRIVTEH